ncbi:MAG: ubiquinol-cytochrome c reductase iron-sulfur subunit [Alphaproteobacteria bacterium]|nr:ubiquinol-cytochrome c reductase iron-sulfur subunit [Alphaproteobacteria bacterium]
MNTDNANGNDGGRRSFLAWAVGGISAALGAILAWPMVSFLVGPIYRRTAMRFTAVGKLDQVGTDPVKLTFPLLEEDAFLRESRQHAVWVVKDGGKLLVFSPICPHLSCYYDWNAAGGNFVCPCHNSVFSATGTVLSGPAPRPLDTLQYKVVDGRLMVAWERFRAGIAEKIPI